LFQMFFFRAVGEGRLAEAFGPAAAETDKFVRIVGFRRAGEAETAQVSPDTRGALEAYSRGVNEFLHTHKGNLPLEFNLLGMEAIEDWQPADTVTFGKVEAWDLTSTWDSELMASDLRAKLGADRAALLMPGFPKEGPFTVPGANSGGLLPLVKTYQANIKPWLVNPLSDGLGSNNWVVDGAKSATGKPLLANDPHLGVRNPSIWYQVHLSTSDGKYDDVGFGFAGVPGIITGHNQNIAWGVTNLESDVQDLYQEKLDSGGHPGQYFSAGKWLPMQVLTETIKVKGSDDITETVRITGHGPIISDALLITDTLGSGVERPFALKWTASQPGKLLDSVLGLQTAANWQDFRAALANWSVPGQNFVYADKQGNIGYQATGQLPVRNNWRGDVPVQGNGDFEWAGFIPFDEMPRVYNPPEHYIATANNPPFGPNFKYPVSGYYAQPWRIDRILEMLKAKDKLSADDFKAMQADTQSPLAKQVAPFIAGLKPPADQPEQQKMVDMFKGWDGNLKTDSVSAAIYEVFYQKVLSETLSDDLGTDLYAEYLSVEGWGAMQAVAQLLSKPDDPFWDKSGTDQKEKRDDILL
ncbi:MAG TPA: penicillin acylase family protein, partial [Anaerolineales bacterium]